MITGSLVRLRPYAMTDLERVCLWVNDPEVTMYLAANLRYGILAEEYRALHSERPVA